ncbi:hypothetical protein ACC778_25900 [Rhizobium ruizarguesonis]
MVDILQELVQVRYAGFQIANRSAGCLDIGILPEVFPAIGSSFIELVDRCPSLGNKFFTACSQVREFGFKSHEGFVRLRNASHCRLLSISVVGWHQH